MKTTIGIWLLGAAALLLPTTAQAQDPALIGQGATVYARQCSRCHNARTPAERTDQQWANIMLHMRARANMTRSQARAVLAFLQAMNVPEGAAPAPPTPEPPKEAQKRGTSADDRGSADAGLAPEQIIAILRYRSQILR